MSLLLDHFESARALSVAMTRGEIAIELILDHCIERIGHLQNISGVSLSMDLPLARACARRAQQRQGEGERLPLFGLPCLVAHPSDKPLLEAAGAIPVGTTERAEDLPIWIASGAVPFGVAAELACSDCASSYAAGDGVLPTIIARWIDDLSLVSDALSPAVNAEPNERLQDLSLVVIAPTGRRDRTRDTALHKAALALREQGLSLLSSADAAPMGRIVHLLSAGELPAALAGHPRAGLRIESTTAGFFRALAPLGVQLVGPPRSGTLILSVASVLEEVFGLPAPVNLLQSPRWPRWSRG